jgi:hypothetical protein
VQNGTTDQVDKIVKTLNEGQVPSPDVVGMDSCLLGVTLDHRRFVAILRNLIV